MARLSCPGHLALLGPLLWLLGRWPARELLLAARCCRHALKSL